jgi:hypothetical protein
MIRNIFFSTNHACAFNRLQYSAAFVATNEFHFAMSGTALFLNTFGWEMVGNFSMWTFSKLTTRSSLSIGRNAVLLHFGERLATTSHGMGHLCASLFVCGHFLHLEHDLSAHGRFLGLRVALCLPLLSQGSVREPTKAVDVAEAKI